MAARKQLLPWKAAFGKRNYVKLGLYDLYHTENLTPEAKRLHIRQTTGCAGQGGDERGEAAIRVFKRLMYGWEKSDAAFNAAARDMNEKSLANTNMDDTLGLSKPSRRPHTPLNESYWVEQTRTAVRQGGFFTSEAVELPAGPQDLKATFAAGASDVSNFATKFNSQGESAVNAPAAKWNKHAFSAKQVEKEAARLEAEDQATANEDQRVADQELMEQILEQVPDLAQCTLEDVTNRVADAISAGNRSPKDVGDLQADLSGCSASRSPATSRPRLPAPRVSSAQRHHRPRLLLPTRKENSQHQKHPPRCLHSSYASPQSLQTQSSHQKTTAPAPSRTSVPTMPLSTSTAPADPYSKKAFYKPNNRRNRVRGGQAVLSAV